ncbi:MAG: hypothetical protein KY476_00505 [Planctomycetes bacterium]|nr:hypothetical protein [Planctomycetota bacterium]
MKTLAVVLPVKSLAECYACCVPTCFCDSPTGCRACLIHSEGLPPRYRRQLIAAHAEAKSAAETITIHLGALEQIVRIAAAARLN